MELLLVFVVRHHYMSNLRLLYGCPTAVKCLQCPHLLITIADLCSMGLICPLWSSCWFLWLVISIYRPFHWCQTAVKFLQGPLLLIIITDMCPTRPICLLWSSCWFLWSDIIICPILDYFNGCPTAVKCLQCPHLLITRGVKLAALEGRILNRSVPAWGQKTLGFCPQDLT